MSMNEDMQKFITCMRCKQVPNQPPLYSCKEGHIICEFCFLESTIGDSKTNICPQCGNRIISRNIFGEELLKVFSTTSMNNTVKSAKKSRSKCSIKPVANSTYTQINDQSNSLFNLHLTASLANTSRRPILCPNSDCKKMIAVTQLISHFQFDHARIPMESLEFNQPKTLILSLNSMDYGKSHCVGLLLISAEKDSFSLGLSQTLNENRIAFPLLAAKLRCIPDVGIMSPNDNGKSSSSRLTSPKLSSREKQIETPEKINYSDIVVIWICGNIDSNLKCLIEVSDENQTRIYSYFGSVNSLRELNDPKSVFERADCLLLHSSSVQRITKNGQYPMDLKVLINCPYDELLM